MVARCCHMSCDHELRSARQREIAFRYLLASAADEMEHLKSSRNVECRDTDIDRLVLKLREVSSLDYS